MNRRNHAPGLATAHPPALRRICAAISVAALMALSGCGVVSMMTAKEPSVVIVPDAIITIKADKQLNKDINGVPKPVQLRIYELRAGSNFNKLSPLDLIERDEALLGSDFIRRKEVYVRPGEQVTVETKGNADTLVFAFFAAYRDTEGGTSKAIINSPNSLELRKTWWGLGSIEKPSPLQYQLTLAPSRIQVTLQTNQAGK